MVPAVIIAIDPATNKPANFRLTDGTITNGTINYLPGTVSYDSTNHIAVFAPAALLGSNTKYTATIITGVKDLAGNPLSPDFAWCFTTSAAGSDVTAPGVTFTDASSDVAVNRKITATFSKDMDSSTIPASFTVTGPGGASVSGTVIYIRRMAVFTPSSNLLSSALYTATITTGVTGVKDLAGNNGSLPSVAWSFTTGASADVAAPVVSSTSPVGNAQGVGFSSTINVTFNEPMDPATITTATFLVTGPGATGAIGPVVGTVGFDTSTRTATFTRQNHSTTPGVCQPTPASWLERNAMYTATLTTGAKDMAGNALASNFVWSFNTGATP
jgi:hypothetical protein